MLGFFVNIISGILRIFDIAQGPHSLISIIFMLLIAITESLTLFYFIGTGKYIKDISIEHNLGNEYRMRTQEFKKRLFPFITGNIALFIIVFVSGGAIAPLGIHISIHICLSLLLAALFFKSLKPRKEIFIENAGILLELNRKIIKAEKQ